MGNLGMLRRKLHSFSNSHSERHPNTLFKLNSQTLTQLKNLNILIISFWTQDGKTGCDSSRFTQHYVQLEKEEWDWLDEHTCTTIQIPPTTSILAQKQNGGNKTNEDRTKDCPYYLTVRLEWGPVYRRIKWNKFYNAHLHIASLKDRTYFLSFPYFLSLFVDPIADYTRF